MTQDISNSNNNLSVVSFAESKPKLTSANKLILALLKEACENKSVITRDNIFNLYWIWKFGDVEKIKKTSREGTYSRLLDKWTYAWIETEYTKKQYFNLYTIKPQALEWFKKNLGAVILKGRLVVLPVIDIA